MRYQENFGFKSCENSEQNDYEEPDDLACLTQTNAQCQRQWFINDLVLFVDNEDMPRIPRKLFEQVGDKVIRKLSHEINIYLILMTIYSKK